MCSRAQSSKQKGFQHQGTHYAYVLLKNNKNKSVLQKLVECSTAEQPYHHHNIKSCFIHATHNHTVIGTPKWSTVSKCMLGNQDKEVLQR